MAKNVKKIITIGVIVIAILFLVLNKGAKTLVSRKIKAHRLKAELNEIKIENERLRQEIHRLKNDDKYIEYRIRRDLGYIRKGEIEYRFSPPVTGDKKKPKK